MKKEKGISKKDKARNGLNLVGRKLAKEKKPSKPLSPKKKKIIIAAISSVLVIAIALPLCLHFLVFNKPKDYFEYFNNFSSADASSLECTLTLGSGTTVSSYDPDDDVYITVKEYVNPISGKVYQLYGLASETKEYVVPVYTKILEIKGDYAVVARPLDGNPYSVSYVTGLIRFRGEGINSPVEMTDFKISYTSGANQFKFVGDYFVVYGDLENYSPLSDYVTFYEYKNLDTPYEKFRLRQGYSSSAVSYYDFIACGDYIAAYDTDKAYFFNLNTDSPFNGYLEPVSTGEFVAFPYLTSEELASFDRKMKVYYMGNGWFARCAYLRAANEFNGYNVCLNEGGITYYLRSRTDFYNVITGNTRSFNQLLYLYGVANEYTEEYYTEASYLYGNLKDKNVIGAEKYDLPYVNPSRMVKQGYSIVYFGYFPYYQNERFEVYTEATFCIMNSDMEIGLVENAIMPVSYVDGVGISNGDPDYPSPVGDAVWYDRNMKQNTLLSGITGIEVYTPSYGDRNGVISLRTYKEGSKVKQSYGASDLNGTVIAEYVYDELTPFNCGYAIGAIYNEKEKKVAYYRIDKQGKTTLIEDEITGVYQNFYAYKSGGKYGLKNYAGEVVLSAKCSVVNVIDKVMKDGRIVSSTVSAIIDDRCLVYVAK